jgi:hypothetical protein
MALQGYIEDFQVFGSDYPTRKLIAGLGVEAQMVVDFGGQATVEFQPRRP